MSKRKTMDKAQARERRNQLLEAAATAELSLTEGVREMRAIAGMTQEEFAAHRGVSARVIKAIELGQGNPTVATLNRIGEFFGLEVAFVPVRRAAPPATYVKNRDLPADTVEAEESIDVTMSKLKEVINLLDIVKKGLKIPVDGTESSIPEPLPPRKKRNRAKTE